jgi:hypothetical protein
MFCGTLCLFSGMSVLVLERLEVLWDITLVFWDECTRVGEIGCFVGHYACFWGECTRVGEIGCFVGHYACFLG